MTSTAVYPASLSSGRCRTAPSALPSAEYVPRWISEKTSRGSSYCGPRERGAMAERSTTWLGPCTPSGCSSEAGSGRSRPSGKRYR